jgi:RNA polymerase sigma-70 factor (sigma-E family)
MNAPQEERFRAWAAPRIGRLHRAAYLLCGDWHEAEELVQDALARAFAHWGRVEASNNADAYVRKILVNEAKQRWRRNRKPPAARQQDAIIVPDGAHERAVRAELMEALRRLPTRQRAAVVLRYFEQLSEAKTAEALGCSLGTVKSTTHRAVAALRLILTPEVDQ